MTFKENRGCFCTLEDCHAEGYLDTFYIALPERESWVQNKEEASKGRNPVKKSWYY